MVALAILIQYLQALQYLQASCGCSINTFTIFAGFVWLFWQYLHYTCRLRMVVPAILIQYLQASSGSASNTIQHLQASYVYSGNTHTTFAGFVCLFWQYLYCIFRLRVVVLAILLQYLQASSGSASNTIQRNYFLGCLSLPSLPWKVKGRERSRVRNINPQSRVRICHRFILTHDFE